MNPTIHPALGSLQGAVSLAAALLMSGCVASSPNECGPDMLGVSRTIELTRESPPVHELLEADEVILTYDDGPHPWRTKDVMTALGKECTRATFFLLGEKASAHPERARALHDAGHAVGSHSMDHALLPEMEVEAAMANVRAGHAATEAAIRQSTPLFRFPYVASTPDLLEAVHAEGLIDVDVTADSKDWSGTTPNASAELVIEALEAHERRGIVLLHDPQGNSAARTHAVLEALKENGYRVVALEIPED